MRQIMQTEKINGRPREKTVFARQIKDQNNWICWHNRQTNQERKLDDAETRLAEIILCHFRFQTAVLSRRQIGEKREQNTLIKIWMYFSSRYLTIYMLICDLLRQHCERTDLRRVTIDISLSAVSLLVSVRFYF